MRRLAFVLLFFTLSFLMSCATAPQPIIKNNTYINQQYCYSLTIPDGWIYTVDVPEYFKGIPMKTKEMVNVMFFNKNTNGFISVSATKMPGDILGSLTEYRPGTFGETANQAFISIMSDAFEKELKKMVDNISGYQMKDYVFNADSLTEYSVKFLLEDKLTAIMYDYKVIIYRCKEDQTYVLLVLLISNKHSHGVNMTAFNSIHKSLRMDCLGEEIRDSH